MVLSRPLASPRRLREIPSVYMLSVFRGDPWKKRTGLNEFDIRHSRDGHSSESRQLFPRPRTRDSIRFDETEIPGSIVLHRGFLFLQFAFFSSSLFINPVTAKRRIENFHFFRCRAHTFGAANGTKKRLE